MRIAFYTLGCKVNQYETEVLTQDFIRSGFELVGDKDDAEVYVINSCTVTAQSDSKTRQVLRRFRRQNPSGIIALCGCFPQAFPEVSDGLKEADIILGTANKNQLVSCVKSRLAGGERIVDIREYSGGDKFDSTVLENFAGKTRAFIKIQDGCERFCAYCIIPHARGPIRSKELVELKKEVENLAATGFKEVVLVGINLSCFGLERGENLLNALETVAGVDGIERIRLGSLEPEMLDRATIEKMAKISKLCPQFHLSLQSGSDATLSRMSRHYDTADYRTMVGNLKSHFENTAITTDIMVGFPMETEEEFAQSLAFAREIGFARAHVFAYSRRYGTAADLMEGQVPAGVKAGRSKEMTAATNQTRSLFLDSQVGLTQPVLFESKNPKGYWEGYTPNYTHVIVHDDEDLYRQILNVAITSHNGESCFGDLMA